MNVTELCRQLRKEMTPSEQILWEMLRNRRLNGYKFTRQKPFFYPSVRVNQRSFFIADFHCAERNLIIELDGPIHDFQREYDANRDEILASLGLKTLRIKNHELKDIDSVKELILRVLMKE
jgi:very-short-patch-repair endonuclease